MNLLEHHQRDMWHVFEHAAKVQARLETLAQHEEERLQTIRAYQPRASPEDTRCRDGLPNRVERRADGEAPDSFVGSRGVSVWRTAPLIGGCDCGCDLSHRRDDGLASTTGTRNGDQLAQARTVSSSSPLPI